MSDPKPPHGPSSKRVFVRCHACREIHHERERQGDTYPCCGALHRTLSAFTTSSTRLTWQQARETSAGLRAELRWQDTLEVHARAFTTAELQALLLGAQYQGPRVAYYALLDALGAVALALLFSRLLTEEQQRRETEQKVETKMEKPQFFQPSEPTPTSGTAVGAPIVTSHLVSDEAQAPEPEFEVRVLPDLPLPLEPPLDRCAACGTPLNVEMAWLFFLAETPPRCLSHWGRDATAGEHDALVRAREARVSGYWHPA